jgi:WD40 repeat protein
MDIRLLSVTSFSLTPSIHIVCTGNSLGVLKIYSFLTDTKQYTLLATDQQHNYPIISMTHVIHEHNYHLYTGGTDGRVIHWNLNSLICHVLDGIVLSTVESIPITCILPLHQSGVNCMHATLYVGIPLLCTGGDDQRVCIVYNGIIRQIESALDSAIKGTNNKHYLLFFIKFCVCCFWY